MAIRLITFSPTGGTKKVADIICRAWQEALAYAPADDVLSIDLCCHPDNLPKELGKSEQTPLSAEDICIIAVPSFKGRVPALAVERLKLLKGNGAQTIEVVVYGNRLQEDTLIELQDAAVEAGFKPLAAITAIAEHSMVRTVAAGRPDAEDEDVLKGFVKQIREKLVKKSETVGNDGNVGGIAEQEMLQIPGNRPYKEFPQEPCLVCCDGICIHCQNCVDGCPAGAVPSWDPTQTDPAICIGCMRCIHVCPVSARRMTEQKRVFITGLLEKNAAGRKENELFL